MRRRMMYSSYKEEWTAGTNMSINRNGHCSAAWGGKLYVFGNQNISADCAVYDTNAKAWSSIASMPTPVRYATAQAVDGKIYVFGGQYYSETGISALQCYDTESGTWTYKAAIPGTSTDNVGLCSAVDGTDIYIHGAGKFYRYSTINNSYTSLTAYSSETFSTISRIDSKLYLVGSTSNSFSIYNLDTSTWSSKPGLSETKRGHVAGVINNKLYIIGGYYGTQTVNQCYNPATDAWTTMMSIPTASYLSSAAIINKQIYVTGGVTNGLMLLIYRPKN
ncbi:MAG: kelch repeat-containing protein [Parabacteroides sp.]|nr:kelch repeat-containing protein [Parabacteroides sp.]